MIIVQSWLQEYLRDPLKTDHLVEALERAGIEVEEVKQTPSFHSKLIVAEVKTVKPHPNADKLRLATIKTGSDELTVVCGAPNVAAGQKVVYAQVGAVLPDGTTITRAKIREVESPGMLCSAKELGLGDDHSGILELAADLKPGTFLNQVIGEETLVDITVAANRPDLQGLIGVSREVAAQTGNELKFNDQPDLPAQAPTLFSNKAPDLVARYSLAKINLPHKIAASPEWLRSRLQQAGVRPINLVVDITNYVMLETGQPLHAFDAGNVSDKVVIRTAKKAEKVTTLDGVKRDLAATDLVIADSRKVIGIAGVMGGANSEVLETTKTILLEAANFNSHSIHKTAISQGVRTEASARFEHGLPVQFVAVGMNRALELLKDLAGAKVLTVEDELNVWPWVQHIGVRPTKLSQLAGMELSSSETVSSLHKLGFSAEPFDVINEAKKYLGTPYKWGASFKQDGTSAFDCGYLVDYIFSLIGQMVGHSAPQIMEFGKKIELSELRPGDMLFRDGVWKEVKREDRKGVSHVAMYIGDDKIIHAENHHRVNGTWQELPLAEQKVRIDPLDIITKDPQFLGARRPVEDLEGWVAVTAPYWRPDVKTQEDIFEEVIKLIGLDKIPSTLPTWRLQDLNTDNKTAKLWKLRAALTGLGLNEAVTYPFVSQQLLEQLGLKPTEHLRLRNPRSVEQSYLRTSLLPSLVKAAVDNTRAATDFGLFEMAKAYLPTAKQLPKEPNLLGVVIQTKQDPAYQQVKNVLDRLADMVGAEFKLKTAGPLPSLHPARQAKVMLGTKSVGYLGELDPSLQTSLKLKQRAAFLELDLDALLAAWQVPRATAPSRYQTIWRDLTVLLERKHSWQDVAEVLGSDVSYVGEYANPKLGASRALSLRLRIEPDKPNPSDSEINQAVERVFNLLAKNFKAQKQD